MSEQKKRSIIKVLTSKLGEIGISSFILQILFGLSALTLGLPAFLEFIQMIWNYLHERLWSKIRWGKECEGCHFYKFHEQEKENGKPHEA